MVVLSKVLMQSKLWAQPAAFSMEHQFHLKETLTNCGYVGLGIWQTFPLKMKKWVWHIKQLTVFAANDKIPTFKQKLELQKTWLSWWVWQLPLHRHSVDAIGYNVKEHNLLMLYNKMPTLWQISVTYWGNVFQMVKPQCYKTMCK